MRLDPTAQGIVYVPVQPVAPVHRVSRDGAHDDAKSNKDAGAAQSKKTASAAELRNARAEVMEELSGQQENASARRFLGLDRDQLASIVFDRGGGYSVAERASIK